MMSYSAFQAGKGLTMVAECMEGNFTRKTNEVAIERERLNDQLKQHRIKGFCDVLVAEKYRSGVECLIQTSGLGGLRHNSVCVCWPDSWQKSRSWEEANRFVSIIRSIAAAKCAILVPKNIENFPLSTEKLSGTVSIFWVFFDTNLLNFLDSFLF